MTAVQSVLNDTFIRRHHMLNKTIMMCSVWQRMLIRRQLKKHITRYVCCCNCTVLVKLLQLYYTDIDISLTWNCNGQCPTIFILISVFLMLKMQEYVEMNLDLSKQYWKCLLACFSHQTVRRCLQSFNCNIYVVNYLLNFNLNLEDVHPTMTLESPYWS